MPITPLPRNLGPGDPWGRQVENRLASLESTLGSLQTTVNNGLAGINGTLSQIATMVNEYSTIVSDTYIGTNVSVVSGSNVFTTVSIPVPEGYNSAVLTTTVMFWGTTSAVSGSTPWLDFSLDLLVTSPGATNARGVQYAPRFTPPATSGTSFQTGFSETRIVTDLLAWQQEYGSAVFDNYSRIISAGYTVSASSANQSRQFTNVLFLKK